MAPLTLKQRRFVAESLKDLNATQAAISAGYSKNVEVWFVDDNCPLIGQQCCEGRAFHFSRGRHKAREKV